MKSHRFCVIVVLLSLSTMAFAQSSAKKSFDQLKSLSGDWQSPVTVEPPQPDMSTDKLAHISLRVTSRGNALVHEMQESGTRLDPEKYDHPVTIFYVDGDRLNLIHYCDAGNRPHMVARTSPDGKTVEFDFADLSGGNEYGHMYHGLFTFIGGNHHIEDWTYICRRQARARAPGLAANEMSGWFSEIPRLAKRRDPFDYALP